jgi:hypothetical protein
VVTELEDKNRRLSDKLNEIIFNKASVYKQKTIEQLSRGGRQISPERQIQIHDNTNKKDGILTHLKNQENLPYRSKFA